MAEIATSMRAVLQSKVIVSRDYPLLRSVYRLAYRFAPGFVCAALRLLLGSRLEAIYLRRSGATGDWTPGASDLDLLLRIAPDSADREAAFLRRLWRAYAGIRLLVPFLGETQVADPREFETYRRHGGARAAEMGSWLRLGGGPSPAGDPDVGTRLAFLHEAISAFLFQSQVYFEGAPSRWAPNDGFKTKKSFLDVLRFVRCLNEGRNATPTRLEEFGIQRGKLSEEIMARLARPDSIAREHAFQLLAISRQWLDDACRRFFSEPHRRSALARDSRGSWESASSDNFPDLADWRRRLHALSAPGFPAGTGLFMDSLFHWFVVTSELPAPEENFLLSRQIDAWKSGDSAFCGQGHLVTKSILQALAFTSYLENPYFGHGLAGAGARDRIEVSRPGAAAAWSGHYRLQWNLDRDELLLPSGQELEALARHASAELGVSLRMYGQPDWGGRNVYRLYYWYTRVLSLHLHLKTGSPHDTGSLEELARRHAAEFPDRRARLELLAEDERVPASELERRDPSEFFYRHLPVLRSILSEIR
ncbi:MAG: hypothetical protein HY078_00220 [Elusimicrobia bacterium]|nr:hypothetical protein [Elusimicrobiota bacterium]